MCNSALSNSVCIYSWVTIGKGEHVCVSTIQHKVNNLAMNMRQQFGCNVLCIICIDIYSVYITRYYLTFVNKSVYFSGRACLTFSGLCSKESRIKLCNVFPKVVSF